MTRIICLLPALKSGGNAPAQLQSQMQICKDEERMQDLQFIVCTTRRIGRLQLLRASGGQCTLLQVAD
eukprot:scaffold105654_cov39-Prasinocladus_malaysianus.AAC.1